MLAAVIMRKEVLLLDRFTYWMPEILREFRTEIIDYKQDRDSIIITTRSYFPSAERNPKHFIQISFDSSVGYNPIQMVRPFTDDAGEVQMYLIRDFIEYYSPEEGVFFPVKIEASVANDIDKLDERTTTGRMGVSSITVNKPVDIPPVEFPPGVVVAVVYESGKTTPYIWGEDNQPLKILTRDDYRAAKREDLRKFLSDNMYIILIVAGVFLVAVILAVRVVRRRGTT